MIVDAEKRPFANYKTEIKILVDVNPRTLRDFVIVGRTDIDFKLDTKIGLANMIWGKSEIGRISVEDQQIGKWEIIGYDPERVIFIN